MLQFFVPTFGANLQVPSFVRPGQPIIITWGVLSPSPLGNVIATISYNDIVLYTSKSIPAAGGLGLNYGAAEENVSIEVAATSPAAVEGLYLIPAPQSAPQILTLSVTSTGASNGTLTNQAVLRVVPEAINIDLWWQWDTQNLTVTNPDVLTLTSNDLALNVDWNTPYSLGGSFFNQSRWSAMKAQLTLMETDLMTNSSSSRGSQTLTADIGPNANVVEFNSITQKWDWITCPSGVLAGVPAFVASGGGTFPLSKNYNYSVLIAIQDPWGNGYPPFTVGPLLGTVSIPHSKIVAANNTQSAFALSIGLAASVILSGGAPFALAAAVSFCGQAQDPPTPDFAYGQKVKLTLFPSGDPPGTWPVLPSTWKSLVAILKFIAIESALSQTEGKLIAARIDKNTKGIKVQTEAYKEFVRELVKTGDVLGSSASEVLRELESEPSASGENTRAAIRSLQMYGVTDAFERAMGGARCSCSTIDAATQFLKSVDPTTLPSIADYLKLLAYSLVTAADYTHQQMHQALADNSSRPRARKKKR